MRNYYVSFNFTVGTATGTAAGGTEKVYDVPDHLTDQALTDHLKKSIEGAGAPRVVTDIKIIG